MRQNDMDEYERNNRMSDRRCTSNLEIVTMIWKEGSSMFTFCSFKSAASDPPEARTETETATSSGSMFASKYSTLEIL